MKKTAIILLFLLTAALLSAFSFSQVASPLYDNIKQQTISGLAGLFTGKVQIESAGGPLIGRIVFNGVKIGDEVTADRVIVSFNPAKLLWTKGDIISAITSIRVVNGWPGSYAAATGISTPSISWNCRTGRAGENRRSRPKFT